MTEYKNELEKENIKLMEIYKEMLLDLNKSNNIIIELNNKLKEEKRKFEGFEILAGSIKYSLDTNSKILNKIYNNFKYEKKMKFVFDPDIIQIEKQKDENKNEKTHTHCICGSKNIFQDEKKEWHCSDCERI